MRGEGAVILWQVHERVSKNGDAFESGEEARGRIDRSAWDGRLAWKSAPRRLLRRESW